jgi:hypothetical protein
LLIEKKEIENLDKKISEVASELEAMNAAANQSGVELTGMAIGQKGRKLLPGEVRPKSFTNVGQ